MTAAEIRAKAAELANTLTEKSDAIPMAQTLATLEVAAQLAELNERLGNLTSYRASGNALRAERTP